MMPAMRRPARMVVPLDECGSSMPGGNVQKMYRRRKRRQRKAPEARGSLRGGAGAKTQGRGSRLWRSREVDQPRMPLRASERLDGALQEKFQEHRRKFRNNSFS